MSKSSVDIAKEAADAVKDFPESLKETAFSWLVDRLSEEDGTGRKAETGAIGTEASGGEDFLTRLSQEFGIPAGKLRVVFELKDKKLRVNVPLEGKKAADNQRRLAYVYLSGVQIGFGDEWTSSVALADEIDRHGANDHHISQNLRTEKGRIQSTGENRSTKYRLTPPGVTVAKEIVNALLQNA